MSASAGRPLTGLVFTLTGIPDSKRRTELEHRIEAWGAKYSRHLTTKVTHLIAGSIIGSQKFASARKLGIPVLVPEFLEQPGAATLDDFLVKPMHSTKICLTGIPSNERTHYADRVHALGGAICNDLTTDCTHLVVGADSSQNVKLRYAADWAIPIVRRAWLDRCIQDNSLQPEDDFTAESPLSGGLADAPLERAPTLSILCDCVICYEGGGDLLGAKSCETPGLASHVLVRDRVLTQSQLRAFGALPASTFVLDDRWLFECAQKGVRVSETPFLIDIPGRTAGLPLYGIAFAPDSAGADCILRLGGRLSVRSDHCVHGDILVDDPSSDDLTVFWLEDVKATGRSSAKAWYHRPLRRPSFRLDHVFSLTGFAPVEKAALRLLLEQLGAACTDTFSRKNTMLLADGGASNANTRQKVEKARCIGIPVGDVGWLLDCIAKDTFGMPGAAPATISTPIRQDLQNKLVSPVEAAPRVSFETQTALAKPLCGCVVSISHRLWHRRHEIHDLSVGLGALFVWTFDASCTHYVHESATAEDAFQELRQVQKAGKHVVHPEWLLQCSKQGARLPECAFPFARAEKENASSRSGDSSSSSYGSGGYAVGSLSLPAQHATKRMPISFNPQPPAPAMERVFIFSGVAPSARASLKYRLGKLGAAVAQSAESWDPQTTHLICARPSGSEKVFAAIASGVWILKVEYVEACHQARSWLAEDEFAWTEADCRDDVERRLVRACLRWKRARPFADWRVRLYMDDGKRDSIERVLRAGGAAVLAEDMERDRDRDMDRDMDKDVDRVATHVLYAGSYKRDHLLESYPPGIVRPADYFSEFLCRNKA